MFQALDFLIRIILTGLGEKPWIRLPARLVIGLFETFTILYVWRGMRTGIVVRRPMQHRSCAWILRLSTIHLF
jgi:hypothetical protein